MGGIGDQCQRAGQHASGSFGRDNREVESDRWRKRTAVRMPVRIAMLVVVCGHRWTAGCRGLLSRHNPTRDASATAACTSTL